MASANRFVRHVGLVEKLYTARQVLGVYHSVIVTATYSFEEHVTHEELTKSLAAAIQRLLHRHPSLGCYVEGIHTNEPGFRRLKTLAIADVLQVEELQGNLSLRLQELHDLPWQLDGKPLWKLVVLHGQTTYLAFVFHHVISDGLGGVAFHRTLLEELREYDAEGDVLKEIEVPVQPLIEPLEKLAKLPLSWTFLIKEAWQEYAPRLLIGEPKSIWAGKPMLSLDKCPYRSRIRIISMPVETLLKICREHKVTLTSLMNARIACSLTKALPDAPAFAFITPYTLRRITGTSRNAMVNQTSVYQATYSKSDISDLWSVARRFHGEMQAELARCPLDNPNGLLPYVSDHIEFYGKKFGREREKSWELSNLGAFDADVPSGWRLEGMTFTQGAGPLGPAFTVNCATAGGVLTLALTWQESVVDEDVVINAVLHGLEELRYLKS